MRNFSRNNFRISHSPLVEWRPLELTIFQSASLPRSSKLLLLMFAAIDRLVLAQWAHSTLPYVCIWICLCSMLLLCTGTLNANFFKIAFRLHQNCSSFEFDQRRHCDAKREERIRLNLKLQWLMACSLDKFVRKLKSSARHCAHSLDHPPH